MPEGVGAGQHCRLSPAPVSTKGNICTKVRSWGGRLIVCTGELDTRLGVRLRPRPPAHVAGRSSRRSSLPKFLAGVHCSESSRQLGAAPGMWPGGVEGWENQVGMGQCRRSPPWWGPQGVRRGGEAARRKDSCSQTAGRAVLRFHGCW